MDELYNAMLQAIRAFMFSEEYGPSGRNQHISMVRLYGKNTSMD